MKGPKQDLNVALLPFNIAGGDVTANLCTITKLTEKLPEGTDLAVLPELCTTGFTTDKKLLANAAEKSTLESLRTLQSLATIHRTALAGSVLVSENNKIYNRGFIISQNGETTVYDKRHLFSSGQEAYLLSPGYSLPETVNIKGWNLKLAICYDLRFPVWNRNVGLGYDVLIVPANWPESRSYQWEQLLKARAIENQAYVLGCNRLGTDSYGNYAAGQSYIIDPLGKIVATDATYSQAYGSLQADTLCRYRTHFRPYLDADSFTIQSHNKPNT